MVIDETRTPSLLSGYLREDNIETNTATRSSSLCSDNIPDLDPVPDVVNNQVGHPVLMRRATPVTFVDRTESATVLISEPSQLHLPRSVAQESIERTQGTIATTTTPVLGPVRSTHEHNADLAEFVDLRFGLDGAEDSTATSGHLEATGVTFTVPNYGHDIDAQDSDSPNGEAIADTTVNQIGPRRISDVLQNMCSRVREFFPTTDVVTLRRTSVAPSTSRRSRVSVTLQRALGEQNLITRAANIIIPSTDCRQPPLPHDPLTGDEVTDFREEKSSSRSEHNQRSANPQTPTSAVTGSIDTRLLCRRASEPVLSRNNPDTLAQNNISSDRNLPDTDEERNVNIRFSTEIEELTDSPSLVQRAWNRLSTTFTSSSRFGSYDSACAPPPTRDERSYSDLTHRLDAEGGPSHSNSYSKTSMLGKRLRRIGSSTMNLARQGFSRSRISHLSEGPQTADEGGIKSVGAKVSSNPCRISRRHVLPSDWRSSVGKAAARLRRRNTPINSSHPEQTGDKTNRHVDGTSEGRMATDDIANAEFDGRGPNKAPSPFVGAVNISGQAARASSERRRTSIGNLKSMVTGVRELSRSEQNVIPL